MTEPALRLVADDEIVNPHTGEISTTSSLLAELEHLRDQHVGDLKTIEDQSRTIGRLTRRLDVIEDPDHQPADSKIVAVVERWRGLCRPKAKVSRDRIKLVKARVGDGFPITSDEELPDHPTIELAVDGGAAMPYLLYGKRRREGSKANLYNDLKDILGDAAKVEESARAGYAARKAGWTAENGWPA